MSEIAKKVVKIVVDKLGVDEAEVTRAASFANDLGADSLDTVELIMEFVKEFNISIPDEAAEKMWRCKRSSNAFFSPTARVRKHVPPASGVVPRLRYPNANCVFAPATTRSQARASESPPPAAMPCTLATTTLSMRRSARMNALMSGII